MLQTMVEDCIKEYAQSQQELKIRLLVLSRCRELGRWHHKLEENTRRLMHDCIALRQSIKSLSEHLHADNRAS